MSKGRWERQPNGDYQHFSDEEIAQREFDKAVLIGAACAIIGPYLIFTNYSDMGDWFYVGCICTLLGIFCIFRAPGETIGAMIAYGIIGGLLWYIGSGACSSDDEKKEKAKTEEVSMASTNKSALATTYDVGEKESADEYEEMDESESFDTEEAKSELEVPSNEEVTNEVSSSNSCWYVFGSKDELNGYDILSDGSVNTEKLHHYFTEIGANEQTVIKLHTKNVMFHTRHAQGDIL